MRLHPSKPMFPGEAWRMNSYSGDQSKRYAAKLPNAGVNRFAGAFSTSAGVNAASAQAPGFTSALDHAGYTRPAATQGPSTTRQYSLSATSVGGSQKRPFSGSGAVRPFKAPSMVKPADLPTVNTVETRLTQQKNAVILNPVTPNIPQGAPYTLPTSHQDDFAYLRGLAKEELDQVAPKRIAGSKSKSTNAFNQPVFKRSRS